MFNGPGPDGAYSPCGLHLSHYFGDMPDGLSDNSPMKTVPVQARQKKRMRVNEHPSEFYTSQETSSSHQLNNFGQGQRWDEPLWTNRPMRTDEHKSRTMVMHCPNEKVCGSRLFFGSKCRSCCSAHFFLNYTVKVKVTE